MNFDWNILLTVPMEKWREHGVVLRAASISMDGLVNSFIARRIRHKQRWYGFRLYDAKMNAVFIVERY